MPHHHLTSCRACSQRHGGILLMRPLRLVLGLGYLLSADMILASGAVIDAFAACVLTSAHPLCTGCGAWRQPLSPTAALLPLRGGGLDMPAAPSSCPWAAAPPLGPFSPRDGPCEGGRIEKRRWTAPSEDEEMGLDGRVGGSGVASLHGYEGRDGPIFEHQGRAPAADEDAGPAEHGPSYASSEEVAGWSDDVHVGYEARAQAEESFASEDLNGHTAEVASPRPNGGGAASGESKGMAGAASLPVDPDLLRAVEDHYGVGTIDAGHLTLDDGMHASGRCVGCRKMSIPCFLPLGG